ncbi:hypothetical protein E4U37_007070 [Claviceps purpurea]|nr:hypothetical protein E4U37_007070 [Claviceps purpurea]
MAAPIKHPQNVDPFDGSEDVQRWLKRLRRSYRQVNGNQDVGPSDLIQAMDSALSGEAAKFVEKSPLLRQIVDQADDFTATSDDLVLFENALRDRFDVEPEVEIGHEGPFPNTEQGEGESLDAYHGRVLSIYRARGGRDKPVTPDQPQLTPLEVSSINEWVHRFVLGLQDKALMSEAINDGALSSDSFRSALQRVKTSSGLLEVKARMARAVAERTRVNFMEGYIRQTSGQSANEELSRAYGLPKAMIDAWGGPRDQAMSVDTLMTQLQPSMAALGISGGWCPQHPQTYFAPRQGQFDWPQQANAFQFSTASHQSAYAPAVAPVPTTAPVPAPAVAPALTITPASADPVRPCPSNTVPIGRSRELKSPNQSRNPYINGSIPLPRGGACFRCGGAGHYVANCTATGDAVLTRWESAWLKSMVLPSRNDQNWTPDRANARSAQVYLDGDALADDPAPAAETQYVGPPVGARYIAVAAEPEPSSGAVERQRDGTQDFQFGESNADDSQVFQFGGTDAKIAGLCATVEEIVVEVSHADIELSPTQHDFHEDADCTRRVAAIEDVAVVDDVTAGDLSLRPIRSLEGVDEDAPESVAHDALWTMTLISETAPPLGKRESMSVTDVFDEDEIPLSQPVMLVREKTVKRNARALSKMWECEDMRPINWKALTNRLSVQFMESWQRDSHFCKFSADLHEQRIVEPFDPGGYCDDIWRKATKASTATKLRG